MGMVMVVMVLTLTWSLSSVSLPCVCVCVCTFDCLYECFWVFSMHAVSVCVDVTRGTWACSHICLCLCNCIHTYMRVCGSVCVSVEDKIYIHHLEETTFDVTPCSCSQTP